MSATTVSPDDEHNRALVAETRPVDWENPTPEGRYNLVVIGGGSAGLVAALGAAGLGGRVALVERHLLGGDCLVTGCVPSKAVLRSAHAASAARHAGPLGVHAEVSTDFGAVMARMRRIRAGIAPHDGAERLCSEGIDVYLGEARFTGPDRLAVGDVTLIFARCCIATGARAAVPPIQGLAEAGAMTNEDLFTLTEPPEQLVVIGAGVIGCEMAQAFAALGTPVSLIDMEDRVLPREEPEVSARVRTALQEDGVTLHLGASVQRVAREGEERIVTLGDESEVRGDTLLVAVGRRPNLDLGLEAAGVEATKQGVVVDDFLRTTNPRIYAAGDVVGQEQFTHVAGHHAALVIRNALFFGRARVSDMVVPRVTYTRPEVAAVGLSRSEAEQRGLNVWTVPMDATDRGRTDGADGTFCSVYADDRGRIHGAVLVAEQAGELLAPITLAMTHGITLPQIASTVHPYPTRSEVLHKVATQHQKARLQPWMKRLLATLLSWRR